MAYPRSFFPSLLSSRAFGLPAGVAVAFTLFALALVPSPATGAESSANLLAGAPIAHATGATGTARLTDGTAPDEGAFWLTDRTARISGEGEVVWDLGRVEAVRCAQLQGDNNDFYHLYGSLDGTSFFPMWTATPVDGSGMRVRSGKIVASTRYVRLTARGGDGLYGVGEMGLYRECPTTFPVAWPRANGEPVSDSAQRALLWFAAAAIGFVLFSNRKNLRPTLLFGVGVIGVGLFAVSKLVPLYPLFQINLQNEQTFESLIRAIVAAIAGALIFKETFARAAAAPHPKVRNAVLGVLALLAFGSYYHFGSAQFWNAEAGRRTHVHTWDLRHYVPIAKYFDELRFDGLYVASLAAYIDLAGKTLDDVAEVRFRDLRDSKVKPVSEMKDHVAEVRARFSEPRWALFKSDLKTFVDIMGPHDYLGGMNDHGGNATPVWVLGAYAILHSASFTEGNLVAVGLIDPVLVALCFAGLWGAFGFRAAAYCAILWGATDFYQFGSNLMGSMLRQDWLVALGLGAAAIRRGRLAAGGALLAYGGLIRAFPATATFFLAVPVLWFAIDYFREHKRLPGWAELRRMQSGALRAIAGAVACVAVFLILTSAVFGARASWGNWITKISMHATDPSVNNVGLRNLMAWKPSTTTKNAGNNWERLFYENLSERRFLHLALTVICVAAVVLAARKRRLEQTAMLGLAIIPFVFYPSNYYCHYIFLLPLVAVSTGSGREGEAGDEKEHRLFGWITLTMLGLCVGQFFTLAEGWTDMRYTYQSALLLVAILVAIAPMVAENFRELFPAAPEAEAAPTPDQPAGKPARGADADDDDDED